MNYTPIIALFISASSLAHLQSVPDEQRQIKTAKQYAELDLTILNTHALANSYRISINGTVQPNVIELEKGGSLSTRVYIWKGRQPNNTVIINRVCSIKLPKTSESIEFEVCHRIQTYYAQ